MNNVIIRPLLCICFAWCALFTAGSLPAQDTSHISASGVGKVSAKPDVLEIAGTVTGQSELAGDAVAKFHTAKQQVIDALNQLAVSGLRVDGQGFSVGEGDSGDAQTRMLRRIQGDQSEETPKVAVREILVVRIEGVDKLDADELLTTIVKIIDAGREAGMVWGKRLSELERISSRAAPAAFTLFKLANAEELRRKAYDLAMNEARANASRLAKLAGVKLGAVKYIQEQTPSTYVPSSLRQTDEDASTVCTPIELTVRLNVNYQLESQ